MKVGAHVSASGGVHKAIDNALKIGAQTIQIFGSSPQSLTFKDHPSENIKAFKQAAQTHNITPVFLHGVYLVNLASFQKGYVQVSVDSLIKHLALAGQLGAQGVIFHIGSHKGSGFDKVKDQIVTALGQIIDKTPTSTLLILENSAGMGGSVGSFSEIGQLTRAAGSNRLALCLDTQHAFAAGFDLTKQEEVRRLMLTIDDEVGLERLVAIHANDSKVEVGGGKDRHQNIGQGFIGEEGFRLLLSHPNLRQLPFIIEAPGFEGKGPDKQNVDILKRLAANS